MAGPTTPRSSVSLTAGDGSDGGSGLDTSSRLYERDSATLTNGSSAFSGVVDDGLQPGTSVASGNCYRYRFSIAANVGNRSATVTASVDAKVDSSAPAAPSLSLAENPADADQHVSGTTLYYKPGANGGTFRVDGLGRRCPVGHRLVRLPLDRQRHRRGTDSSSPYEMDYSWGAATAATGSQNVTAQNNAGTTIANGPFTLRPRSTRPDRPDARAPGGPYSPHRPLAEEGDGSDGGSGLDTSSRLYERDSATLTQRQLRCLLRLVDDGLQPGHDGRLGQLLPLPLLDCRQRRQPLGDGHRLRRCEGGLLGAGGPLALSGRESRRCDQHVSGTTLYYKPGANGGTFRVTASAADAQSGIASVAFPSIANVTGGGTDSSSPYEMDYSWGAATAATGSQNVTAQNNAGTTSANGPFTLSQDSSAPTGQTLSLVGGPYYTSRPSR